MSKIVISGYYGFNNAGDEALLTAILAALRAVEPTADITVISGNPGNTIAKHQVKSMYRFAAVRLLRAIGEADLVISGGGSVMYSALIRAETSPAISAIGCIASPPKSPWVAIRKDPAMTSGTVTASTPDGLRLSLIIT